MSGERSRIFLLQTDCREGGSRTKTKKFGGPGHLCLDGIFCTKAPDPKHGM